MSRRFKRHIFLPVALLVYFAVMAVMAYPRYKESGNWGEYFGVLGGCLLIAIILFFILRKRQKIRSRFTNKDLNQ